MGPAQSNESVRRSCATEKHRTSESSLHPREGVPSAPASKRDALAFLSWVHGLFADEEGTVSLLLFPFGTPKGDHWLAALMGAQRLPLYPGAQGRQGSVLLLF